MADGSAGIKEILTKKVGPLPVGVYVIAGGVGIGIFLRMRKKKTAVPSTTTGADIGAADSAATTATLDPTTGLYNAYDPLTGTYVKSGVSGSLGGYAAPPGYSDYYNPNNGSYYDPITQQYTPTLAAVSAPTTSVQGPPTSAPAPDMTAQQGIPPQPSTTLPASLTAPAPGIQYAGPIISAVADPNVAGGFWQLTKDGSIYALGGAPYWGGPTGDPATNWTAGHRVAAQILARSNGGYTIVDTAGEKYSYGPDYNRG